MRWARTFVVVGGVLATGSAFAGPPAGPGKKPATPAQTELELVRVERVNNDTLSAGSVVPLNVIIANRGTVAATVAAGISTQDAGQGVVRSGSTSIAAGGTKTIQVKLPITPRAVRQEKLAIQAFVADPKKPATGNLLDQLFRDTHLANNSKGATYAVRVELYDVRVVWRKLEIKNDCEPGDAIGKWKMSFEVGNLTAADASGTGSRYHMRGSYLPRPGSTFHWPKGDYRTVSTGQTIALHEELIKMTSVPKSRHLAFDVAAHRHTPPFSYQTSWVGSAATTLAPSAWNFGGTLRRSPVKFVKPPGSTHNGPHGPCGDSPYVVELQITTSPTVVI
jgi:hypothetical protein